MKDKDLKELAEELHEKYCSLDQIETCGWYYDSGDVWEEGYSHKVWLKKTKELVNFCKDNNYNLDKFINEVIPFINKRF